MKSAFEKPLTGIIPPMATPLLNQNTLDVKGLERLTDHLLEGGVRGLFILGTTGEAVNLGYELRFELTERVCDLIDKRVPVLVGITDTSMTESIRMAEKAAEYGADAVVAAPPYYYTTTQEELASYFYSLAEELPLPLFLYNMPSHTKIKIEPETVSKLAEHSNIIGLKDSTGDMIHFQQVALMLKGMPDFTHLVGPEQLLKQSVLAGGHGGVNGGANLFPHLYVEMYRAARREDFDRMKLLQERIIEISLKIYRIDNTGNGVLKGVKCALSIMGICNDYIAKPLQGFNDSNREKLEGYLKELNPEDIL